MYNVAVDKDLLKKPKISGWVAGPAIAIAWFLFWPVGIYLTYRRARIDKRAAIVISSIVIVLGLIFFIGGLRFLSGGLTGDDAANMNVLIIMGLIFIFMGVYTRKSAKRFLKYISLVVDNSYRSIEDIAQVMNTSYDKAAKDLRILLKDGYFNGYYIDDSTMRIGLYETRTVESDAIIDQKIKEDLQDKSEEYTVACKSCGANNKVIAGKVGECEFCGSPISI